MWVSAPSRERRDNIFCGVQEGTSLRYQGTSQLKTETISLIRRKQHHECFWGYVQFSFHLPCLLLPKFRVHPYEKEVGISKVSWHGVCRLLLNLQSCRFFLLLFLSFFSSPLSSSSSPPPNSTPLPLSLSSPVFLLFLFLPYFLD